jgi:NADH:ubiquinone oxidoreductase subunit K
MIPLQSVLIFAAALFAIGLYGVLIRRNGVMLIMSIELMLNAVNLNLLAFAADPRNPTGQHFAVFVICIAAAEAGLALAMLLRIFRNRASVDVDELDTLRW